MSGVDNARKEDVVLCAGVDSGGLVGEPLLEFRSASLADDDRLWGGNNERSPEFTA